jgi:hypothetical protein
MTPQEKTLEFIEKNLRREKDKWDSGMKSQYYQWDSFRETFRNAMEMHEKSEETARADMIMKVRKEKDKGRL